MNINSLKSIIHKVYGTSAGSSLASFGGIIGFIYGVDSSSTAGRKILNRTHCYTDGVVVAGILLATQVAVSTFYPLSLPYYAINMALRVNKVNEVNNKANKSQ